MNVPLFKAQSSSCGHIMGRSGLTDLQLAELKELQAKEKRTEKQEAKLLSLKEKNDNPDLPDGAKTYCKEWLKGNLYNRQKDTSNKYCEKGNVVEDNSLDFLADFLGYGMLIKNERHIENDFISGTPDVILPDLIIDVKNSWDCFTFPLFDTDLPNSNYYWQMQCYMILANKPNSKVIYVLSDTPEYLIQREAFYYCRNNDIEMEQEVIDEFIAKMTYPDIPDRYKIKVFDVPRRPEAEVEIVNRVKQCREYIETLMKGL